MQRPGRYTNYAFGGARARPVGLDQFSLGTLGQQVDLLLEDFPPDDDVLVGDTLYVLWIGGNDLRDALAALQEGASPEMVQNDFIAPAIQATAEAMQQLYFSGGRSFLVLNQPNIGNTPALRAAEAEQVGAQLSAGYNAGLNAALDQLEALPQIVILRFDVFAGLEELVQFPDLAGLTNVMDSCITPDVIRRAICASPRKYLFWDFIHPTRATHAYIAEQVEALLDAELQILPSVARYAFTDVIAPFRRAGRPKKAARHRLG